MICILAKTFRLLLLPLASFNNIILLKMIYLFILLCELHRLREISADYTANVSGIFHLGLWRILRECTLPPLMSWSKPSVISLRRGPSLACAALYSWHDPAGSVLEARAWTSPWVNPEGSTATPDSSLVKSLNTVGLEMVPHRFLLPLVILVTFLKSPCSSLNVVRLEGKKLCHPGGAFPGGREASGLRLFVSCSIFPVWHHCLYMWRYPQWIKTLCQCSAYIFSIWSWKMLRRPEICLLQQALHLLTGAGAALAERGHLCGLTGVPHKQLSQKDGNQLTL